MIYKIFSKIQQDKLLHLINKIKENDENSRINMSPDDEFLQASILIMKNGLTFKPHKHIFKNGEEKIIAQESWVVVRGKVKVIFYDTDDQILETHILESGDCSMTFYGGHNYEILEDNTIVYEFKNGPYKGQKLDKVFI